VTWGLGLGQGSTEFNESEHKVTVTGGGRGDKSSILTAWF